MKAFVHAIPKDLRHAATLAHEAKVKGQSAAFAGGGSDVVGLMKERIVTPDVLVYLKGVKAQDAIVSRGGTTSIGGLTTLAAVSRHETLRRQFAVLAEAAETVATPQIRNVATIAGNVCQRPWCWYYRNGFPCLKNGGTTCFSVNGENQYHAIFGGGPSYIVHPSDTAPALVALNASFRIVGPAGSKGDRMIPAGDFFALPSVNAARENVLADDEVLAEVTLPAPGSGTRSIYHKVMDREAWTHAIVSAAVVMRMDQGVCRSARVVLGGVAPVPWRLTAVEEMLAGQTITASLAAKAGEAAVVGARPLAKNRYKVPMTQAMVSRAILELAERNG
jgi:xanthine dehydrogenase YagS FAD-binding subunit